jgi:predicted chitinase
MIVDKGAGYSICALDNAACTDIKVRNNIAAGVVYAGFVTVGHECGDYNRFDGNVAHSVKGLMAGHGLYFKQGPTTTGCVEYSNFMGYKCYYQGAFAYPDDI